MTTLAVELSASRLLGSVFGTSNIVWANVIGLILLYLAVGYYVGGRVADRWPNHRVFYRLVTWSAFLCALIPLLARPVLVGAASAVANAQAALALGSFLAVLLLFSAPVTLLGCVSPFAVRLVVDSAGDARTTGRVIGQIYALGTMGSLVGTFLPVIVLIPELGTTLTFLAFAGVLFVIGWIGIWRDNPRAAVRYLWMPLLILLLLSVTLPGPLRPALAAFTLLYEDESAYNYIQVQEDQAGNRYLYLNEGQGIHSQWNPNTVSDGRRTWSFFLVAPYFNPAPVQVSDVKSLAIVGLAAGTIARQYSAVYGPISIDGIEIDPGIVNAGERFFEMDRAHIPGLTVYIGDARYLLSRLPRQYDVIALDAYRPPYIPWHLTTVEFFQEVYSQLTPNGVAAINVGRTTTDRRLVDALTNTLLQVFPSVHAVDVPSSFNTILYATRQPTAASNLEANWNAMNENTSPVLMEALEWGVMQQVPTNPIGPVFTDDRAPVETLVDSLVINFLLSGQVEQVAQQ